jgi:hypothetical protein
MKLYAAISVVFAALLSATAYALGGHWVGATASIVLGGLWLAGLRRGSNGIEGVGLVGFVGIAAVGAWLELSASVLLVGIVAALVAWDLDRFAQRLRSAGYVEAEPVLVRAHLQRLLIVAGVGLLLGLLAGGIQAPLGFGWVLGLGALAIVGLSRAIRAHNRASEAHQETSELL